MCNVSNIYFPIMFGFTECILNLVICTRPHLLDSLILLKRLLLVNGTEQLSPYVVLCNWFDIHLLETIHQQLIRPFSVIGKVIKFILHHRQYLVLSLNRLGIVIVLCLENYVVYLLPTVVDVCLLRLEYVEPLPCLCSLFLGSGN